MQHGRCVSSGGTALRKMLWLDLSSAGKRAEIYFHEEERGRDVSEIQHIGVYRDTK